jgi:hypothetical protein
MLTRGPWTDMGKNTPERKDYIMENLLVTVERVRSFFT